jgi:tripartite-type tricarboxylate transporter receptor subunit TctC
MKLPRRQFLHLAAGAAVLPAISNIARAQTYPTRPVRIIVPFPPGGSTDVAARIIGESLSRSFGRQVFVENRAGAGGNVGLEAAARSSPDGYTFLVTTDWVAGAVHVSKLNIDPLKDLVPVIYVSRLPVVLAVHPSLGVNSIAELIALAKQQPGLNYVIGGGTGNEQHFVAEWFAQIAGIKLAHVPYRGGGQAINDLIAGHVKIGSLGSTPVISHYEAGSSRNPRLRARRACQMCRPIKKLASMAWCSTNGTAYSYPWGHRQPSQPASMPRSTRRSPTCLSVRLSSSKGRSR